MTYTYDCDGWCGDGHDSPPALMGEFSERWFTSSKTGGKVSELGYEAGDIITFCGSCTNRLLSGR